MMLPDHIRAVANLKSGKVVSMKHHICDGCDRMREPPGHSEALASRAGAGLPVDEMSQLAARPCCEVLAERTVEVA